MRNDNENLDLESQFLLYLADELPVEERAELDARLVREPELTTQLARLREAQAGCMEAIRRDDETTRLPVNEGVAVRRAARAMQQWQVERLRRPVEEGKRRRGMPWWGYPAAVAAVIIIGFLTWSMRQEIKPLPPENSMANNSNVDDQLADWMDQSFGATADAGDEAQLWLPAELPGMDEQGALAPIVPEETIQ